MTTSRPPSQTFSSARAAIIPPNLVQLTYRSKHYEGHSKDFESSRLSMDEHWPAGYHDAVRTLRHPEALQRLRNREGVYTFDLAVDGRE